MNLSQLFETLGNIHDALKINTKKSTPARVQQKVIKLLPQIQEIAQQYTNRNLRSTNVNPNRALYEIGNRLLGISDGLSEKPYMPRLEVKKQLGLCRSKLVEMRTGLNPLLAKFAELEEAAYAEIDEVAAAAAEAEESEVVESVVRLPKSIRDFRQLKSIIPEDQLKRQSVDKMIEDDRRKQQQKNDDEIKDYIRQTTSPPTPQELVRDAAFQRIDVVLRKWNSSRSKIPYEVDGELGYEITRLPIVVFTDPFLTEDDLAKVNFAHESLNEAWVFDDQLLVMFDEDAWTKKKWVETLTEIINRMRKASGVQYVDMMDGGSFFSRVNKYSFTWLLPVRQLQQIRKQFSVENVMLPFDAKPRDTSPKTTRIQDQKTLRERAEKELDIKTNKWQAQLRELDVEYDKIIEAAEDQLEKFVNKHEAEFTRLRITEPETFSMKTIETLEKVYEKLSAELEKQETIWKSLRGQIRSMNATAPNYTKVVEELTKLGGTHLKKDPADKSKLGLQRKAVEEWEAFLEQLVKVGESLSDLRKEKKRVQGLIDDQREAILEEHRKKYTSK